MPKVRVYLPDDLYRAAREHGLPISALTRRAIEAELQIMRNKAWLSRLRSRPQRHGTDIDMAESMDDVRAEFGR